MFRDKSKKSPEKPFRWVSAVFLLTTLLAAYANHFHNSFDFDDAHTRQVFVSELG